jgi:group II intron reverse transcriptase/maturase
VRTARQRCWRYDWVLDIDVRSYFDSIDWELLLKAVRQHTDCPWVLLYIERWLKAPERMEDGSIVPRTAGTPQGGVISPLPANLFLHYAFDMWMTRTYPHIPFERYADDIICHCKSADEARALWSALTDRFAACKLILNPEKTKIVYCKDANRRGDFPNQSFDFLGFTFRARKTVWQGHKSGRRTLILAKESAALAGKTAGKILVKDNLLALCCCRAATALRLAFARRNFPFDVTPAVTPSRFCRQTTVCKILLTI